MQSANGSWDFYGWDLAKWVAKNVAFRSCGSGATQVPFGKKKKTVRNAHLFVYSQRTVKGASGKGSRQKTSKIVKKCQKYFRHFSTLLAQGKKRQKSSKSLKIFSTLFDNFRAAPVFRPLLGGSDIHKLEIHHLAVVEGGGKRGAKNVNKHVVFMTDPIHLDRGRGVSA